MTFEDRIRSISKRYNDLNDLLLKPQDLTQKKLIEVSKEHSDLTPLYELSLEYLKNMGIIDEAEQIINSNEDSQLRELAYEEKTATKKLLDKLKEKIKLLLLPKDSDDEKNAILEIRAGTGGEEAALFAADLFRMYNRYSERCNWKFEVISFSETGLDGCKEANAVISGKSVYKKLKYESGVHRVQRVPSTEASGRLHTSAATVAVLPEAEDVDIKIEEKDLRIDSFRGSGSGGQHVNTTDSAIRITHIPTGIVVVQGEKSQHQNKAKAMKILRSRLYEIEKQKKDSERSELRKDQVGTGDRSERIRTYNFPQNRVTDHRINLTIYNLDNILNEGKIEQLVDALISDDQAKKLAEGKFNE